MDFFNITHSKKAVCYYRHSAEDKQENSVAIQREHAQRFAKKHKIEIIHEEADEGVYGLSADRPAFQKLLNDWVLSDQSPPFEYILVYDVSRWGRFQNPDQAAMYQYQCTARGKQVVFIDDGMPQEGHALITNLQTAVKRFMAAEYSRQLSEKVFFGSAKISEQGYSAGGTACYGLARLLLDINKKPVRILKKGEHKQISNERVIFVPANDSTPQIVRDIFNLFVYESYSPAEIAIELNERFLRSANGGAWNQSKVLKILRNEAYVGTRIYNKRWSRLKQKSRLNPRGEWIICRNAFPAIIASEDFQKAQEKLGLLVPNKKNVHYRLMNAIQNQIRQNLADFVHGKGIAIESDLVIKNFPMIFSSSFHRKHIPNWCFLVTEQMRNFDTVLAISIDAHGTERIDGMFKIPTSAFNAYNYLVFSKGEKMYADFSLEEGEISKFLETLFHQATTLLEPRKLRSLMKIP